LFSCWHQVIPAILITWMIGEAAFRFTGRTISDNQRKNRLTG
jgi:hypothetical protein